MVVVTMTSWVKRIYNVLPCLKGLMKQTYPADLIYLNLSKDEFTGMHIPDNLAEYINEHSNKIILNWVEGPNTKAFKKIFPILKYLRDDDIILDVDDDFVVPSNFILSRLKDFNKYQTAITTNQVTYIEGYANGMLPELQHHFEAGSLFQKKMLSHWDEILSDEIIKTNHDDAFYGFLCWLNGWVPESCTSCFTKDYERCFKPSPSLHGSIGCAGAVSAITTAFNSFKLKYNEEPHYNYFNTNTFNGEKLIYKDPEKKDLKFIIIDRLTRARDNGEYFYRYLKENEPDINIVFGLHRESEDWDRLKEEGFNLLDISNQNEIKKEAVNCTHFLFSEANLGYDSIVKFLNRKTTTFIYLNHGCYFQKGKVVYPKDKFDYMICGNKREYDATTYNAKQHGWNSKSYLLTGFPRMDEQVIKYNQITTKNIVLIQPWWRENLTGWKVVESTNKISQESMDKLLNSNFVKGFNQLLNNKEFKDICEANNLQVVFKRHPVMEHIPGVFQVPDWIMDEPKELFIDLFAKTKVYITDYSSNAWEVANLGIPCIYFEPDYKNLTKNCNRPESIWNIKEEGLGPVTFNVEQFLNTFKQLIFNNFKLDEEYIHRRNKQIAFLNDTHNCERVFNEIINLKTPVVQLPKTANINNAPKEKYSIQDFSFLHK